MLQDPQKSSSATLRHPHQSSAILHDDHQFSVLLTTKLCNPPLYSPIITNPQQSFTPLRSPKWVIEVNMVWHRNKGRGKREIPEKTHRLVTSFCTVPTCENLVTQPGIEPGGERANCSASVVRRGEDSPPGLRRDGPGPAAAQDERGADGRTESLAAHLRRRGPLLAPGAAPTAAAVSPQVSPGDDVARGSLLAARSPAPATHQDLPPHLLDVQTTRRHLGSSSRVNSSNFRPLEQVAGNCVTRSHRFGVRAHQGNQLSSLAVGGAALRRRTAETSFHHTNVCQSWLLLHEFDNLYLPVPFQGHEEADGLLVGEFTEMKYRGGSSSLLSGRQREVNTPWV
ncbi:hypothetical protein PR048_016695 [Dryococelus australis]|uniref:Uncharacterized protein n=1 Tax=Dryococelus australis TaxID=614101 RepID=A0ABQ9H7I4_9NEOP|nr:hypothetical protein PR048_016695 [Dryococelus australis]